MEAIDKRQLLMLEKREEKAKKILDYENAHNPSYIYAISIVEQFLKDSKRICYGGQAINAQLPKKFQFYNEEFTLPDYDFFTPTPEKDIEELKLYLEKAGFFDVYIKEALFKGTTKLYVRFTPIADVTYLDERIYHKMDKDAAVINGIHYADTNFLRMMLYLELSRPRGLVDRWNKIFERLLLLNYIKPLRCKKSRRAHLVPVPFKKIVINYIKEKKLVFAGADLFKLDRQKPTNIETFIVSSRNPILFYSHDIAADAKELVALIKKQPSHGTIKVKTVSEESDIVPSLKLIYHNNNIIIVVIEETQCHSYITYGASKFTDGLRIASFDTLITLYLSFRYVRMPSIASESILCLVQHMTDIEKNVRLGKHLIFPDIALECTGRQTTLESLVKLRKERVKKKLNILDKKRQDEEISLERV